MLHAHEAVEAIIIAVELIVMGDQQLFAEAILAGHELPVTIIPFAQQRRGQLIARVTVSPEECLSPHLRRQAVEKLKTAPRCRRCQESFCREAAVGLRRRRRQEHARPR